MGKQNRPQVDHSRPPREKEELPFPDLKPARPKQESTLTGKEKPFPVKAEKAGKQVQSTTPPLPRTGEKKAWTQVVGRKACKKPAVDSGNNSAPTAARTTEGGRKAATSQPAGSTSSPPATGKRKKGGRRRVPRTAAVILTCPLGAYKMTLRLAMDKIDLASLDINGLTAKKAVTGAQLFEMGGPNNKEKMDALASRMKEVLADKEEVVVYRRCSTAEIKIRDLTEAMEKGDVLRAVTSAGLP